MMNIRCVLFDFEGTLVDFQWNLEEAVDNTLDLLRRKGIKCPTRRYYADIYNWIVKLGDPDLVKEVSRIFDRYDFDALLKWKLQKGALLVLDWLHERGIPVGLVSNVGRKALGKALTRLRLRDYLSVVISRDDVVNIKPNGEGIKKAVETLASNPSRTLFVGDSRADVYAAREAGIMVAVIASGEEEKLVLQRAAPDYLLGDITELMRVIDRI